MRLEPRFPECLDCRFYSPRRFYARCIGCGAGEYFEEKERDVEPTDNELMEIFRKMDRDDD